MSKDFKDIYEQRKAEQKEKRRAAFQDSKNKAKEFFRGANNDYEESSESKPHPKHELTPEEKRASARYGASYKHFLEKMYHTLAQDYVNFSENKRSLLVSTYREHSEDLLGHRGQERRKDGLHYYFFDLGISKAVSIAYDPETKKYQYHKFDRTIDHDPVYKTHHVNGEMPRTVYRLVKVDTKVSYHSNEMLEFETLENLRKEFKTDIADALLRAPGEMMVQIPRSTWAGLRDFGLKKIFALALVGGVLYSCTADAQPNDPNILNIDQPEYSQPEL